MFLYMYTRRLTTCNTTSLISLSAFFTITTKTIPSSSPTNQLQIRAWVPFKVKRIWPFFSVVSRSFNSRRLISADQQQEVKDEVFTRLVSRIKSDPASSRETLTAYIEKLCRCGHLIDIARLLRSLHDKHIFLRPKTYDILVKAASENKDVELLLQIFKDLLLSGSFLGAASYSNLAKAFVDVNDSVPLLKFVGEVCELMFPNNTNIINRIIFSFGESGQMDKALLMYHHMKDLNCKRDVITYNMVVDILGRAGKVNEMLHEFASMKKSSIAPDIITYNTLINSLRKMGRLDMCLEFVGEMGENGFPPDLRTYTALVDSFGRLGRVEEALNLLGEMKRRGISPSIYIYRALISNLRKVGKLELAISLMEEMDSCVVHPHDPRNLHRKNS